MSDSQVLSKKVTFKEAISYLGLTKFEFSEGINVILKLGKDDGLEIYFDEHLIGVPTTAIYGQQYDENGEYADYLLVNQDDKIELGYGLVLDSFYDCCEVDNNSIFVNRLKHKGVTYEVVENDGTVAEKIFIKNNKFYLDRDELIEFKKLYISYCSDNAGDKKPNSKNDERIIALKYWLIGNSGKSIHNKKDLQNRYNEMGSPTRDTIWDGLEAMDNKLFSAGRDDFLKAIKDVINLKKGTGNRT